MNPKFRAWDIQEEIMGRVASLDFYTSYVELESPLLMQIEKPV